ncbi:MAG: sugar nucleotide-binding protein [Phycisphaeraceae bacterium]
MKWLLLGGDGLLGAALADRLDAQDEDVWATTRRAESVTQRRPMLDLTLDPARWQLPDLGGGDEPAVAVISAAVASLQRCEQEPAGTRRINAEHAVLLARRLVERGLRVVFVSSDRVYDGTQAHRRAEEPTCPVTEYGRQKATAERGILALSPRACVVRLTKVLDRRVALFDQWRHALADQRAITPFNDMVMAPLSVDLVVRALEAAGRRGLDGIVQVSGPADVTYEAAARHLARRWGADAALIRGVSCREAGFTPQLAPPHTTLDTRRLRDELGMAPAAAWEVLEGVVRSAASRGAS